MLSKEQLSEYEKVVRTKHPGFDPKNFKPVGYNNMPAAIDYPEPVRLCSSIRTYVAQCCGFSEMCGLYPLTPLTPVQKAILALWLHWLIEVNPIAGFIATSSSSGHNHVQTECEKNLMAIGFEPIYRGHNGAHGSFQSAKNHNFVTLWLFRTAESTPIPGLTPPAEEKPTHVVHRKSLSPESKARRPFLDLTPRKEKVKVHGFN